MINWQSIYGYNNCGTVHKRVLLELPPKAVVVEVGVAHGKGIALLAALREELHLDFEIWGVDKFVSEQVELNAGYSEISLDDTEAKLKAAGVRDGQYKLLVSDSAEAAKLFKVVDYVFLDADHTYEGLARDIKAWWPKVKVGGFIGGHDWDFGSVKEAVFEVFPEPEIFGADWVNSWLQKKVG